MKTVINFSELVELLASESNATQVYLPKPKVSLNRKGNPYILLTMWDDAYIGEEFIHPGPSVEVGDDIKGLKFMETTSQKGEIFWTAFKGGPKGERVL